MKTLNGKELSGFVKERQATVVRGMKQKPRLLIIRDSDNPVIEKYVSLKIRYGEDIGINTNEYKASNVADIETKIKEANKAQNIHGIILQLPITDKDQTDALVDQILPSKDVDGLGKDAKYDSATATAINWLLAGYGIPLKTSKIAIVGRGKLVGAPLYKMFQNSNYDVSLFHRGSNLTDLINYDIIISATGVPGLIKNNMVKPGATLVDAGTASEKGIIKGDLDPEIYDRKDLTAITPKIGGVGPLTISCLFEHVIEAYQSAK